MPQTLGAFLAIMAVMTFSLNYHQTTIRSQQTAINSEMEVMANAVASDVMNYIASKPFDARTADNTVTRFNRNTDLLTLPTDFGSCAVFENCNDIDDFDSMSAFTRSFEIDATRKIDFDIEISVAYVDDSGRASSSPTWIKEVTVQVSNDQSANGVPLLIQKLRIKRQFSPQW
ncbi:MAG: hypothetical protein R3178_04630 [Rhodothermales bacterium]|nr:hypothetical protein [Rhodothermales bacterium]